MGRVWASSLVDGCHKRDRATIVRPVIFGHVVCAKIIYFQEKYMFDAC